jgi:lipopolysaccharide transport system permease protein
MSRKTLRLVVELTRRELIARHQSSAAGALWFLLQPLLMLAIYVIVFGEILQVRWPGVASTTTDFSLRLFAGLIVFNFFAESASRAPHLIVGNTTLVKKVVFPLPLLCVANVLANYCQMLAAGLILIAYSLIATQHVPPTAAFFPLCTLGLVGIALGISWTSAAIGTYFRDLTHVTNAAVAGLMFLSPVFFPTSMLPERWRWLAEWNPLTIPIEHARLVLAQGELPTTEPLLISLSLGFAFAAAGYAVFVRLRPGFADVL